MTNNKKEARGRPKKAEEEKAKPGRTIKVALETYKELQDYRAGKTYEEVGSLDKTIRTLIKEATK